jgi:leucyl aminopeptidase (aminopeptidase T)
MNKRKEISRVVFESCLNISAGEKALILTDKNKLHLAEALYDYGRKITETCLHVIPVTRFDGDELRTGDEEFCAGFDVIIAPTTMSVSHTSAIIKARRRGARVATMPGITDEIFDTALMIDYQALSRKTRFLQEHLVGVRNICVNAPAGTEVCFSVEGRSFVPLDGCCHTSGCFVNLPDGEVMIAPLEESVNGRIVFDLSLMPDHPTSYGVIGLLKGDKVIVDVEEGRIVSVSGSHKADIFRSVLEAADNNASIVAEFAIGTNPAARIIGNILMDEKVAGTVHFAFGSNVSFGGRNQSNVHLDGVIGFPDVIADSKLILKRGQWES